FLSVRSVLEASHSATLPTVSRHSDPTLCGARFSATTRWLAPPSSAVLYRASSHIWRCRRAPSFHVQFATRTLQRRRNGSRGLGSQLSARTRHILPSISLPARTAFIPYKSISTHWPGMASNVYRPG